MDAKQRPLDKFHKLKSFDSARNSFEVLLCGSSRHRGEPLLGFSGLGPALPVALGDFEDANTTVCFAVVST